MEEVNTVFIIMMYEALLTFQEQMDPLQNPRKTAEMTGQPVEGVALVRLGDQVSLLSELLTTSEDLQGERVFDAALDGINCLVTLISLLLEQYPEAFETKDLFEDPQEVIMALLLLLKRMGLYKDGDINEYFEKILEALDTLEDIT